MEIRIFTCGKTSKSSPPPPPPPSFYLKFQLPTVYRLAQQREKITKDWITYLLISFFTEKLLLASQDPKDYAFLAKGVPTVDAIDDYEEFKATEVGSCRTATQPRNNL